MQPKCLIDDGKYETVAPLKLKNFKCTTLLIDLGNFPSNKSPSRLNTLNNVNLMMLFSIGTGLERMGSSGRT